MKNRDYFINIMSKVMNPYAISLLKSEENARILGQRDDAKEIEKEVARVTKELASLLVDELESEGLLEGTADETKFKELVRKVIQKYKERINENQDGSSGRKN